MNNTYWTLKMTMTLAMQEISTLFYATSNSNFEQCCSNILLCVHEILMLPPTFPETCSVTLYDVKQLLVSSSHLANKTSPMLCQILVDEV
jgi:hypothetical protein